MNCRLLLSASTRLVTCGRTKKSTPTAYSPCAILLTLLLPLALSTSVYAQAGPNSGEAGEEARYNVDFQATSLREFIDSVGRITGREFIIDPRVQGTISLSSQRQLSADELFRVFQNELQVNGYATVPLDDGQIRIVPAQASRTQPLPFADENSGHSVATTIIAAQNLAATTLAGVLQPLVDSQVGTVTPWPESGLVVVTDWSDNLQRLQQLAGRLDSQRDLQAEVIHLQHASANDLADTLDSVMTGVDGSSVRVIANPGANVLVAYGNAQGVAKVRRLAAALDEPQSRQRNTRVIYLDNVNADSMVEVLSGLTGQRGQADNATQQAQRLMQLTGGANLGGGGGGISDDGRSLARLPNAQSRNAPLAGTLSSGDGEVGFAVHPSTNALVLIGPSARLDELETIIGQLDIRRAQVAVEAIIAEISESRAERLGLQWLFGDISGGTSPVGGFNYPAEGQPGINTIAGAIAQDNTSQLGQLLGSVSGVTAGVGRISENGVSFAALLSALQSDSDTNLLSTPSLTTLDNAEAYILVGQEVPFVTGSTTFNENPYQIIQREDIGVSLRIRPSISSNNTIRMDIVQEVSSIAPNIQASDVVTNKREIETSVITRDGGVVVLGGLISSNDTSSAAKVPLLGDIPMLGNLFQYSRSSREKQNLMIFIRARVIRSGEQMDVATGEKYRYMRAQQLLAGFEEGPLLDPWAGPSHSDTPLPTPAAEGSLTQANARQWLFPAQRSRLGSLAP